MKSLLKKVISQNTIYKLRSLEVDLKGKYYELGNNVECPICEKTYSKFLPFRRRVNALCPNCRSLERHRMLYLVMRDKMHFFSSKIKLLHFAPEKCIYNKIKLHPNIEYVTADYMTSFMENIGVVPDYVMSVDDIKFEDESFDVVICIGILLLVPDDHKAIREIYRVLRKGGYAIFQDPIQFHSPVTLEEPGLSPEERLKQYGGENHMRYYGRDYKDRLERHGFKVTVEDYVKQLDTARYGLSPYEYVYIAHKN